MTLFCKNGRSDSLVLKGASRAGNASRSPSPTASSRRSSLGRQPRTCLHPRSSTRTSICGRRVARTRRRSRLGTAAAAAGGYCAILAMPNTDPVVDSAAVLGSLVETAKRDAVVLDRVHGRDLEGLGGDELTELGELADAGAAAFTDDGRPVTSAGLLRRALQYGAVGRTLALHCEEPTLSRDGQVHEGAVCASSASPRTPRSPRARWSNATSRLHNESRLLHLMHLCQGVGRGAPARVRARDRGDGGGDAAPPRPHRRRSPVAPPEPEDESAAPRGRRPAGAFVDALRDGTTACVATDHAPHSREEKEAPFEEAPFGVTGLETSFAALYTHLVEPELVPLETLLERMSGVRHGRSGCPSRSSSSAPSEPQGPARPRG